MDFPKAKPLRLTGGGGSVADRAGRVVGLARNIVDDGGIFFPLGFSFFWALWGWKHDRDRAEQNMQYMAEKGFDYFRHFCEVGGGTWADRTINPMDPDFENLYADMVDTAYEKYGLRQEVTLFAGGTGTDYDRATDKFRSVMESRQHMIVDVEISNEDNGPSHDEQRRLVQKIRSWYQGLVATSSFGERDSDVANFCTDHLDRAYGDGGWRAVRQPWDVKGYKHPGSQNEPIGPHSSVAETWDPLRLCMLRAVGILCGMTGFVLHTGAGVRGGGAADLARSPSRRANFWEYGIDEIVAALRAVESVIPLQTANWTKTRHHWDDHPLRTDNIWPDGFDHGVVRAHAAYSDREFVVMPFGVKNYDHLKAKRDCEVQIFDPMTGVSIERHELSAGELLRIEGATDPEASEAYIITGTFK